MAELVPKTLGGAVPQGVRALRSVMKMGVSPSQCLAGHWEDLLPFSHSEGQAAPLDAANGAWAGVFRMAHRPQVPSPS